MDALFRKYGLAVKYSQQKEENPFSKFKFSFFFLCKRLIKFYFNYWTIFLVIVILGTTVFERSLSTVYGSESTLIYLFKDFWGLQGIDSYIPTWWFNKLIITLYLLFPVLFWLMEKKCIAIGFMLLLFLWPREWLVNNFFYIFELWNSSLVIYTLAFAIGIFVARHEFFFHKAFIKINSLWILIFSFFTTAGLFYIRYLVKYSFVDAISLDTFIALFLSIVCVFFCKVTHWKLQILSCLGKHSMNMYLTHTFLLMHAIPNIIYKSENAFIIFFFLLAESLFVSMFVEFAKRKIGFYRFLNFVTQCFTK